MHYLYNIYKFLEKKNINAIKMIKKSLTLIRKTLDQPNNITQNDKIDKSKSMVSFSTIFHNKNS